METTQIKKTIRPVLTLLYKEGRLFENLKKEVDGQVHHSVQIFYRRVQKMEEGPLYLQHLQES